MFLAAQDQEALDKEEGAIDELRDAYDEGFEDFESDTATRTGKLAPPTPATCYLFPPDVGDDMVDDKTDDMAMRSLDTGERKTFGSMKEEIIALLDELEAHLKSSLIQMQEDEIQAAVDFADWKISLENETAELQEDVIFEEAQLKKFAIAYNKKTNEITQCGKEFDSTEENYNNAVTAYKTAMAKFDAKVAAKEEEIELFAGVCKKYEDMAKSVSDTLKGRVGESAAGNDMTDHDRTVEEVSVEDVTV